MATRDRCPSDLGTGRAGEPREGEPPDEHIAARIDGELKATAPLPPELAAGLARELDDERGIRALHGDHAGAQPVVSFRCG